MLDHLSGYQGRPVLSFHPPTTPGNLSVANTRVAGEKKENTDSKIVVLDFRPLAAKELLNYLEKRCIPLEIANRFCKEVGFFLYVKKHTVIGFQNNAGGYELCIEKFKGSSSPKDITFIDRLIERTYMTAQFEQLQQSAIFKMQEELLKILFEPQQGEHQSQSLEPHWLMELKRKKKKQQRHRL